MSATDGRLFLSQSTDSANYAGGRPVGSAAGTSSGTPGVTLGWKVGPTLVPESAARGLG